MAVGAEAGRRHEAVSDACIQSHTAWPCQPGSNLLLAAGTTGSASLGHVPAVGLRTLRTTPMPVPTPRSLGTSVKMPPSTMSLCALGEMVRFCSSASASSHSASVAASEPSISMAARTAPLAMRASRQRDWSAALITTEKTSRCIWASSSESNLIWKRARGQGWVVRGRASSNTEGACWAKWVCRKAPRVLASLTRWLVMLGAGCGRADRGASPADHSY
eukprot:scaffold10055_cov101-Isochrysis_galbana.AAC.5